MNKQYTGKDYSKSQSSLEKLTSGNIEMAADHNMPLCMKVSGDTICSNNNNIKILVLFL